MCEDVLRFGLWAFIYAPVEWVTWTELGQARPDVTLHQEELVRVEIRNRTGFTLRDLTAELVVSEHWKDKIEISTDAAFDESTWEPQLEDRHFAQYFVKITPVKIPYAVFRASLDVEAEIVTHLAHVRKRNMLDAPW